MNGNRAPNGIAFWFSAGGHFAVMLTKGAHIEVEGRLCSREQIFELKGSSKMQVFEGRAFKL